MILDEGSPMKWQTTSDINKQSKNIIIDSNATPENDSQRKKDQN